MTSQSISIKLETRYKNTTRDCIRWTDVGIRSSSCYRLIHLWPAGTKQKSMGFPVVVGFCACFEGLHG